MFPVIPGIIGLACNILVPIVAYALSSIFRRPQRESPTLADIEARHRAEQAQKEAEAAAQAAQDLMEEIRRKAEEDRRQARARQEEAHKAAAHAAEEAQRMREQMEEAANAAKRAEELAQKASKAAKEEAERLARQAQEERERSRKIREDAEREMKAAREEAKRTQKAADERRREAEAGRALAEEMAHAAAEETRKAMEAKGEAERRLKEGIQPVVTPTPEELAAAKRRIQYREDCFHFAVAGISGSGKSSLVNAFRGLRSRDKGSAAVGVKETTLEMTRYADTTNPENPYVWYDVPGAGTLKCRDWQYFNDQGLYVFDCIIVLFDSRFTMTDIAILVNARRFNIPTYIVRSKADQHIRNTMVDMGYDSERDGQDVARRNRLQKDARKQFIEETRESVKENLKDANLPDQRVYIVSNSTLWNIMLKRAPKKVIDEYDLLNDLFGQADSRRVSETNDSESFSDTIGSGSRV